MYIHNAHRALNRVTHSHRVCAVVFRFGLCAVGLYAPKIVMVLLKYADRKLPNTEGLMWCAALL